jgi:hypothetical protein
MKITSGKIRDTTNERINTPTIPPESKAQPAKEYKSPWASWTDMRTGVTVETATQPGTGLPPTKRGIYNLSDYATGIDGIKTRHCRYTHHVNLWESAENPGHFTCRICHPPAPGAEKQIITDRRDARLEETV